MADLHEIQKNVVRRWFEEVWNRGRREAIDEMLTKEAVLHDGREEIRGPEEFKRFYDDLQNALTDIHVEIVQMMAEDNVVFARWVSTAKAKGSDRHVEITGMSVVRFDGDTMQEAWQNWDKYGLMEQLQAKAAGSTS